MAKPTKLSLAPTRIAPPEGRPFRLNLGAGNRKFEDHIGLDSVKGDAVDYVVDLTKTPWPIDDGVVDGIMCCHVLEHFDGPERIPFIDECWRILKVGGQVAVISPHWNTYRAHQDPFHKYPPLAETSFLYFNKGWREQNLLTHYPIKSDFDFTYGYQLDTELSVRNAEYQQYAIKHYSNAALDLHVTLTKRG